MNVTVDTLIRTCLVVVSIICFYLYQQIIVLSNKITSLTETICILEKNIILANCNRTAAENTTLILDGKLRVAELILLRSKEISPSYSYLPTFSVTSIILMGVFFSVGGLALNYYFNGNINFVSEVAKVNLEANSTNAKIIVREMTECLEKVICNPDSVILTALRGNAEQTQVLNNLLNSTISHNMVNIKTQLESISRAVVSTDLSKTIDLSQALADVGGLDDIIPFII